MLPGMTPLMLGSSPITMVGGGGAYATSVITIPAERQAGDMCIIFSLGVATSSSTPPTLVTPTGFTMFGTNQTSTRTGPDMAARFAKFWKVLNGTETTAEGMLADATHTPHALTWVFRKKEGTWATPVISEEYCSVLANAFADQTIGASTPPRVAFSGALNAGQVPSMSPAASGAFSVGPPSSLGIWRMQPRSAPSIVVTPEEGRGFASGYVGVTL